MHIDSTVKVRMKSDTEARRGTLRRKGDLVSWLATHKNIVCEGLIGPGVVEGCGQVNVPVQYHQEGAAETAQRSKQMKILICHDILFFTAGSDIISNVVSCHSYASSHINYCSILAHNAT